ncbi:MAG: hypothetical protein GC149_12550 [Gammaproteobacteria bacterium]|nr:hypothetical protein [Gammaproteobacteria bacterium]
MVQIIPSEIFVQPPEIKTIREVKGPVRTQQTGAVAEQAAQQEVAEQVGHLPAGHPNREQVHAKQERRTYCRRIYHRQVLEELRSNVERRRHDEEGWAGPVTHIDEEV